MKIFLTIICFLMLSSIANAACNCASVDQANPCTGTEIAITVTSTDPNPPADDIDSVFTWTFNSNGSDARCGQFANGDYWVAPASGETGVTFTAITGSDSISVDADPVMESMGLLDGSNSYGNYDSTEDLIANGDLPVTYSTMTSLVAAIQHDEVNVSTCGLGATPSITGECVDSYNVVTVLTSVPENAGSTVLRPNITGESKAMLTLSDFDFTRLPDKSYLTGTDTAGYEAIRQRWSHSTEIFGLKDAADDHYSEGGRAFRSRIIIDDYGNGVAKQFNNDLMIIFSDEDPLADKQAALVAMMTYGHDTYNALFNQPSGADRDWGSGSGQHVGKLLTTVLMASLMVDTTYADVLKAIGPTITGRFINGPQELLQTNTEGAFPVWGDRSGLPPTTYHGAYWTAVFKDECYDTATPGDCEYDQALPDYEGGKNQHDPYGYIDGPPNYPGMLYMSQVLGNTKALVASMFLMPEICDTVNYDPIVTYSIRVTDSGLQTADDLCTTPDTREVEGVCNAYTNVNCVYYGRGSAYDTWGPVDPTDPDSDCIKADTSAVVIQAVIDGYVEVGRFKDLDGNTITPNTGYTSSQVEANWSTIVNASTCVRSRDSSFTQTGNSTFTETGTTTFTQ